MCRFVLYLGPPLTLGNRTAEIVEALMGNVVTDMTISELVGLAGDLKGLGAGGVETAMIPGTARYIGGVSYVIPDQAKLKTMVQRVEAGDRCGIGYAQGCQPVKCFSSVIDDADTFLKPLGIYLENSCLAGGMLGDDSGLAAR